MRAAGIPARIVTGYHGGTYNPYAGYWIVRQSNAHAWDEIWIAGEGWLRVDPTSAIAPDRVEPGLDGTPAMERGPAGVSRAASPGITDLRLRLDALGQTWRQRFCASISSLSSRSRAARYRASRTRRRSSW